MDPNSILTKTPKGVEEVETRKHKLEPRLRPMLIMVNGKSSAAELAGKLPQGQAMLDELVKQGFVEGAKAAPAAAAAPAAKGGKPSAAGVEIARALSAALGPDGDSMAMKLEEMRTAEEVKAYLEERRGMLDSVLGKAKGPAFWAKAKELLG